MVELKSEQFVQDPETGELLHPLRAAVNERLCARAGRPRAARAARRARRPVVRRKGPGGRLHRRDRGTRPAGDRDRAARPPRASAGDSAQAAAADLKRLYAHRGNAYVALQQWQQAIDDFAHVVTDATTDETLLSNQALRDRRRNTRVEPLDGAQADRGNVRAWRNLSILPDHSILVSGENPAQDRYHVDLTLGAAVDLAAVRLEASRTNRCPQRAPAAIRASLSPANSRVRSVKCRGR